MPLAPMGNPYLFTPDTDLMPLKMLLESENVLTARPTESLLGACRLSAIGQ